VITSVWLVIMGWAGLSICQVAGVHVLSIHSSSLQPVLAAGDSIITKEVGGHDVQIGDGITYRAGAASSVVSLHVVGHSVKDD
jgi:signal peptidase I